MKNGKFFCLHKYAIALNGRKHSAGIVFSNTGRKRMICTKCGRVKDGKV